MASDSLAIYYVLYRNYRILISDILFVEEIRMHKENPLSTFRQVHDKFHEVGLSSHSQG